MKIAFIYLLFEKNAGIERAIKEKAYAISSLGNENINLFVINPTDEYSEGIVTYKKLKSKIFPFCYLDFLFKRYSFIEKISTISNYDYIILRYPYADGSGVSFVKRHKVITEHHTNELSEISSNLKIKAPIYVKVIKKIRYLLENKYGSQIIRNGKGIIAVTDEIKDIELKKVNDQIPSITIPNGITVANINQTGFERFDGQQLNLVCLLSRFNLWQGFDRLLNAIENYRGEIKIFLHLIGNFDSKILNKHYISLEYVQLHGEKEGAELDNILRKMHLGVAGLGLFRKNMEEACALKVRDYTARGLPFIIGHRDPDLSYVDQDRKFYLSFENNDSPIDIKKIISFAEKMSKGENPKIIPDYMREYANKHMDWKAKMRKYIEFVSAINSDKTQ